MTLVLGAHHSVTTSGLISIAKPLGISVVLSAIPSYIARDPGVPSDYYRLGHMVFGNALGWLPRTPLVNTTQLVYPLPDELTLVAFLMQSGVHAEFDEIVRPPVDNYLKQPWDRNPSSVQASHQLQLPGGTAATTWLSYTVPASRKFLVTSVRLQLQRFTANTAAGVPTSSIATGAGALETAALISNVLGTLSVAEMQGGPLVFPAGTTFTGTYANPDTGGIVAAQGHFQGIAFDV